MCRQVMKGGDERVSCPAGCESIPKVDGIWRALFDTDGSRFAKFRREYSIVRDAEGRRFDSMESYRALPFGVEGPRRDEWRVRAKSYEALIRELVDPLTRDRARVRFLDLGAGNGWLSHRLSAFGLVWSVDISDDPHDGLGVCACYGPMVVPVMASNDVLPFGDRSVDLAIFNASFHYSERYEATLAEALRVAGEVVVMDTPVYRDAESGRRMVEERRLDFLKRYGFASDGLKSEGFLTHDRIRELALGQGVRVELISPVYDAKFALRPITARFKLGREPARFFLIRFSRSA